MPLAGQVQSGILSHGDIIDRLHMEYGNKIFLFFLNFLLGSFITCVQVRLSTKTRGDAQAHLHSM